MKTDRKKCASITEPVYCLAFIQFVHYNTYRDYYNNSLFELFASKLLLAMQACMQHIKAMLLQ